jgi:DNA-binding MarR family transcriptional regulator
MTVSAQDGSARARAAVATADPPQVSPDQLTDAMSLIQLSRLVQAAFARVADRHDLTPMQARLLCVLAESPRGMAELAREFGVEKAALTGLVDRAERRGLVERRAVPGDRRAVRVTLTRAGQRTGGEFHAEVTAELGQLMTPLTAGERASFRTALATITQPSLPRSAPAVR